MTKSIWQKYKREKGGLTAKAVAQYRKENPNSKLKTGVKVGQNSNDSKCRWGRFLVRFYGRKDLPPLKKPNGEPTRLAKANTAWKNGSIVKSVAQARKLASKGRKLLKMCKSNRK